MSTPAFCALVAASTPRKPRQVRKTRGGERREGRGAAVRSCEIGHGAPSEDRRAGSDTRSGHGIRERQEVGLEHAVFAGATAATIFGAVTGRERVQQVAKPLIAPALATRVLRRRDDLDTADAALLVAGLAAATVGDVFMIDPDVDARLRRGATSFGRHADDVFVVAGPSGRQAAAGGGSSAPRCLGGRVNPVARESSAVAKTLTGYGALLGTTATLAADPALAPGASDVAGLPMPTAATAAAGSASAGSSSPAPTERSWCASSSCAARRRGPWPRARSSLVRGRATAARRGDDRVGRHARKRMG